MKTFSVPRLRRWRGVIEVIPLVQDVLGTACYIKVGQACDRGLGAENDAVGDRRGDVATGRKIAFQRQQRPNRALNEAQLRRQGRLSTIAIVASLWPTGLPLIGFFYRFGRIGHPLAHHCSIRTGYDVPRRTLMSDKLKKHKLGTALPYSEEKTDPDHGFSCRIW